MTHETPIEQPVQDQQPKEPIKIKETNISHFQRMNINQLQDFARNIGLKHTASLPKSGVVFEVVRALSERPDERLVGEGVLEVLPDGFGFLRSPNYNYLSSTEDIYVSPQQIKRFELRKGDTLKGPIRAPKEREKYFALAQINTINGKLYEDIRNRVLFENLTPLYPTKRLHMETIRENFNTRILDIAAPIGKGQRGLIVAPPKSGRQRD